VKNKIHRAITFSLLIFSAGFFFARQEIQREFVQVLNIEMLVRVMKDGRPLAGLQKGEFSLLENGRKQEINGFLEVHRRITPGETVGEVKAVREELPGRLFLLFFWINEPAVRVDEILDYFFKSIYRQGDRIVLADQRHSLEINNAAEKEAKVEEFKSGLLVLSRELRLAKEGFKLEMESFLQEYLICIEPKIPPPDIQNCANVMVRRYRQLLKEYRLQDQTPNADRFESLTRSLQAIDADKWALVFFQHDSLPLFDIEKLKLEGYQLGPAINEIEKVNRDLLIPVAALRLTDSLRTRFIQANTQFHLLLLDSRQAPAAPDASSGFTVVNPFPVFSNWEETFRQMAAATGGEIMDSNRMQEALAEVANREDVYYVLTYAPAVGESRERRIDIQVGRQGARVIHGRRLEIENLPGIRLKAIRPAAGKVCLDLENVYMVGRGGSRSGLVRVSLFAAREGEKAQALVPGMETDTTGSVEIPIGQLPPGRYRLAVQVVDCLTGLQAQGESELDVLGGTMPAATSALLQLAAAYSERMRHAAFRFICQETVTEDVLGRDSTGSYRRVRNSWLYEYQVVVRAEQVTESRVLLRKNRTKKRVENATLETRFRSAYSTFLPATLFAAEKQSAFFYQLEKHERMHGRQMAQLSITPRPGFEELGAGIAWVDEETGAVLKIELSQNAIQGIEAAEKRAQQSGARLLVSDVHYYEVERDGICLPSRTSISELYIFDIVPVQGMDRRAWDLTSKFASFSGGNRQLELSRTSVEYSDFRFFVVDVQVREGQ
jgi:hypothetical protein